MSIELEHRNHVRISGSGKHTMVMVHGFGCDQSMWRLLAPRFTEQFRVITFDLVGSGQSDLESYDREKYASLHGFADDLIEIIRAFSTGPVIFVGHSVSAIIGMLAAIRAPELFIAQVMIGPSPSYINDGDYHGGFTRADIDDLLATMDSNYLGWSSNIAPAIMGAPDQPELGVELTNSFCRTDPDIARHFASTTFLSDHRDDVARSTTRTLILQCSDDIIAPRAVGQFMHRAMQTSHLEIIDNIGHCPHLSAPTASSAAIDTFLQSVLQ